MPSLSRREFTQQTLGSLLTLSFLDLVCGSPALAAPMRAVTSEWLKDLDDLGRSLKGQKVKQTDWQKKVEELFARVDVAEFLKVIDFEKLTKDVALPDHGARSLRPALPEVEGLPKELVFGRQIFAVKKGRSVVPHGHNNMATAFLVLKGGFRGRLFDRVQDIGEEQMLIRPTIDRSFAVGEPSTISDEKDNIHWFEGTTETAFLFNIHVMNITPGKKEATGRVYLNPNGEKVDGGLIRAPRITYEESVKLFG
jgi:hypothetical protein